MGRCQYPERQVACMNPSHSDDNDDQCGQQNKRSEGQNSVCESIRNGIHRLKH